MKIERMQLEHIKDIALLEQRYFSVPWSENGIQEELENKNAMFFVAINDEEVVGYIGAHVIAGECYIANLVVSENYRRKGIASALINTLCDELMSVNADFVTLEVRKSNDDAISLYKNNGFDIVGERKDFYDLPKENAYIMTKYFKGENK